MLLIVYVCFICIFIHTNSYFTRTFSQFSTSMSTVRRVPYMNHQPKLLPSRQGQRPSTEHQRPRTLGYFEAVSLSHKEWNMPLGTHTHTIWYDMAMEPLGQIWMVLIGEEILAVCCLKCVAGTLWQRNMVMNKHHVQWNRKSWWGFPWFRTTIFCKCHSGYSGNHLEALRATRARNASIAMH